MYPLKLKPVIKDYIWGGRRLIDEFGCKTEKVPAAEAWVLSCRDDGECTIENGEYAGKLLSEIPGIDKKTFPLLVKLIDAERDLSIQVHPSKECVTLHPEDEEKTEMWYVVDCEQGAHVILGFNKEFENEQKIGKNFRRAVEEHIEDGTLTDICRTVEVHPGDVIFVEPGTLHAICRGILIAEIQQNSNTTYRMFDYGRLGADGKPRELHTERALDAIENAPKEHLQTIDMTVPMEFGDVRIVAVGDIAASIVTLHGESEPDTSGSYHFVVIKGNCRLSWEGGALDLKKGDSVFVPRGVAHRISGDAEFIVSRIERDGD